MIYCPARAVGAAKAGMARRRHAYKVPVPCPASRNPRLRYPSADRSIAGPQTQVLVPFSRLRPNRRCWRTSAANGVCLLLFRPSFYLTTRRRLRLMVAFKSCPGCIRKRIPIHWYCSLSVMDLGPGPQRPWGYQRSLDLDGTLTDDGLMYP